MDDLARFPFFRLFAAEALATLGAAARWQDAEAGEVLLEPGTAAREVFFIAEGQLRIVLRGAAGREIILGELNHGEFFGEAAALDGGPAALGLVALTPARVCIVPAAPFLEAALSTPEASHQVMRMLAVQLREREARLMELMLLPVRPRLIALLLRMSRPAGGGAMVVAPARPHHELAARIGTRREVVTRILGALTREGLAVPGPEGLALPQPQPLITEVETSYRKAAGGQANAP
ncbi:Crp/Fnr family transcriptional regulator [Sediminicoccus sp. BL-A-41-H5]|uniref:Crp/Fnr family transcriptional regulator n=1 Tax=Sediminicoccus sp. BL-A-41-H5 TaxID=3421106 RepID=UPI003D66C109